MQTAPMSIVTFGQRLRKLRESSKLSLRQVAGKIGIDASLLGKIERSERAPTNEQMKQVALFFSFDEKQLIQENLSDMFAIKIIEQNADIEVLDIARRKVDYLLSTNQPK